MPLKTFVLKTYVLTLQCDACNHEEEHICERQQEADTATRTDQTMAQFNSAATVTEERFKQLQGWYYSYHKMEPVWEAHSRFGEPDKLDMTQKLLCPQCSKDNL
jgi:hypothetical protein